LITTPDLTVTTPDLTVTRPDLTVTTPDLTVTTPDLTVTTPDLTVGQTMSQKHYVMIPLAPWGHSRPEIILALRLLRLHPHLVITLFTRADGLGKAISLISAFNLDFSQSDRLRIVAYPLLGPPPANPLSTTEDNAATWQLAHWVGDTVLPVLKRFLQVSLCRKRTKPTVSGRAGLPSSGTTPTRSTT